MAKNDFAVFAKSICLKRLKNLSKFGSKKYVDCFHFNAIFNKFSSLNSFMEIFLNIVNFFRVFIIKNIANLKKNFFARFLALLPVIGQNIHTYTYKIQKII